MLSMMIDCVVSQRMHANDTIAMQLFIKMVNKKKKMICISCGQTYMFVMKTLAS